MWPQYTYLALVFLGIGLVIAKEGEPAPDYSIVRHLVAVGLTFVLLYFGGFFRGMF